MAESILNATEQDLETGQAKITFLGTQTKPIPTVTFASGDRAVLMDRFLGVQPGGQVYGNDHLPYTQHFSVNPSEFHRLLAAVKPLLTAPQAASAPILLSFAVTAEAGGAEFRVNPNAGRSFYLALINALDPGNQRGRAGLGHQLAAVLPGAA